MENIKQIEASWVAFEKVAGPLDKDNYDQLVGLADAIIESGQAGPGERLESLFLILSEMIEALDRKGPQLPDASPADVVRFLIEQHDLKQTDLPEIGNQSVVSQVLSGRRSLNVRQITALCQRFGIGPGAFIKPGHVSDRHYSPRRVRRHRQAQ